MWDLPRPGLEPVSPALAGGFLTTAPRGKSLLFHFWYYWFESSFFFLGESSWRFVCFAYLFRTPVLIFIDLFCGLFIVSISFISTLIFIVSFLLLILGFICSYSSSLRCKLGLREMVLVFWYRHLSLWTSLLGLLLLYPTPFGMLYFHFHLSQGIFFLTSFDFFFDALVKFSIWDFSCFLK